MATRRSAITLLCVLSLQGCAVGPDFERPAPPAEKAYSREPMRAMTAEGETQHLLPGAELRADWWRLFGSEPLDAVVAQALANSPTLAAAQANLRQSQDELRAGEGVYFPRLDLNAGGERARSAPIETGSSAKSTVFNVVTLSGVISYPLDLFGGARRALEGQQAQVENQGYALRAATLALTANVVLACIAQAAYEAQLEAERQLIALEREQLRSIEAQAKAGMAPFANVLSQRSLIASDEATLALLDQRATQARHLLAQLQGLSPAQAPDAAINLTDLELPRDLPLSLPSALVRQRPDILSAEAQLHMASANIGVATAAEFPSFGLSAGYGGAGSGLGNLSAASGRFWSIGPSLTLPLFHGGTLRGERDAAVDAFDTQQALYRQTVLAAFAQVADALKALQVDAVVLQAQGDAEQAAAQALSLLRANYRAGLVAALDVLAAEVQYRQALIGKLRARAQRQQDTVALFAAFGGGWWNEKP